MSPMSNCPNRACELTPNSSNMADPPTGRGTKSASVPRLRPLLASALHQRAAAVGHRPERFFRGNGGAELVVVPGSLRFRLLLYLEEIHRADYASFGAHGPLAGALVVGPQSL